MDDTGHRTEKVRPDATPDASHASDSGFVRRENSYGLASLSALAKECGGGFIPIPGRVVVDSKLLAHCMGVEPSVVNGWLNDNKVPVFQPGRKQFIDAEVFLSHLPVEREDAPAKTRKARKR